MTDNLLFEPLVKEDVKPLTEIMTRAFDYDSKIHLGKDKGGPEGYDNGEFLEKWAVNSTSQAFKIFMEGNLIGAVILWIGNDGTNFLGNIFIDPSVQNMGVGSRIWRKIEVMYPDTRKWATDTPGFSKRNHNFYVNKCGFKIVRIDNPGSLMEESYILEKEMIS